MVYIVCSSSIIIQFHIPVAMAVMYVSTSNNDAERNWQSEGEYNFNTALQTYSSFIRSVGVFKPLWECHLLGK